jgi:hypothetical protein
MPKGTYMQAFILANLFLTALVTVQTRRRSDLPLPVLWEPPLLRLPPRIPVTETMLIAYQAMRGVNDRTEPQYGPLRDTLYYNPRNSPPNCWDAKVDLPNYPQSHA